MQQFRREESGYAQEQGTKPQTLGVALNDSPAGLLAWIVEKFRAWSDCDGHPENAFTRDQLITNVMTYWVTQTDHLVDAAVLGAPRTSAPEQGDAGVRRSSRPASRATRRSRSASRARGSSAGTT